MYYQAPTYYIIAFAKCFLPSDTAEMAKHYTFSGAFGAPESWSEPF